MDLPKELSAITECSICRESFVDPRVLPCVHTFCLKCLECYGKNRKPDEEMICPLCRAVFELPANGCNGLPVNFFIVKLLDIYKVTRAASATKSVSCDACSDTPEEDDDDDEDDDVERSRKPVTRSAVVYCFVCRQSLCRKCSAIHNKLRHNKSHVVVEFGKQQPDELLKTSPTYCEFHQDEVVKFFCYDCQSSICMSCFVESHSSHKCCGVAKVAEDFLEQLQGDVAKVSDKIDTFLREEKILASKRGDFLDLMKSKNSLVREMVRDLQKIVDSHGDEILADLESVKHAKLKEVYAKQNELENLLAMMNSFKRYSQEVMTKASPADIARLATMLKKRAAELHETQFNNYLCTFDVDLSPLHLMQLLSDGRKNLTGEFLVYSNRKDELTAYLSPAKPSLILADNSKAVVGLTTIRHSLYLLCRISPFEIPRMIIATDVVQVSLPDPFEFNGTTHQINQFTHCKSIICRLQLWYSKTADGVEALELVISNLILAESDENMRNSATLSSDPQQFGQPLNINQTTSLRSPQKFYAAGFYGVDINIQTNATGTCFAVQATFVQFNANSACPVESQINVTTPSGVSPSYAVEVYDIEHKFARRGDPRNSVLGGGAMKVQLLDQFQDPAGTSYSRTSYTQCDSLMLHLQVKSTHPPDVLQLEVLRASLSESDGIFDTSYAIPLPSYLDCSLLQKNQSITIKAPEILINNGFQGINLDIQISGAGNSLAVAASMTGVRTTNEQFPADAHIEIPDALVQKLSRPTFSVLLPPVDPTDLAACCFNDCLYVGDNRNSSIHRIDPKGKMSRWLVGDSPNGLSISPKHTLLVTSSKTAKLREYTTAGIIMRDVCLTGVTNPRLSMQLATGQYLVTTDDGLRLITVITEEAEENAEAVAAERVTPGEDALAADSETVPADAGVSEEPANTTGANETKENNIVSVRDATNAGAARDGAIWASVDQFGYIFVLANQKVQLLDPNLVYIHESVSLGNFGIQSPSKIHFHPETGQLFVTSTEDAVKVRAFQVTHGKIDPSVWKK